ncbi:ketoreductase azaE [Trichoderma asperellum]|uniref:Ketoreductase azaE n=1 Tax=Trichoderma asperellum TaxID=101201 RepID=A0A6V8QZW6_TRIAP|nr:hypothetical protein LI328DRAFT_157268 [Trichoderma asperelloides]GFP58334.1 ketoreductase azaE [Trichoderma asperellum]
MTKVLLTGGSGFIAAHILEQLLAKNYTVITTVRTKSKADLIRQAHADLVEAGRLSVAVVPDIAVLSAFDDLVAKIASGPDGDLEYVIHTASPLFFTFTDAQKEIITPALNGTRGILEAVKRSAPSVKRVVITSSFAAILSEEHFTDPNTTFSESSWNPDTVKDANRSIATGYHVSKVESERLAWAFVKNEKPSFDLVTVNPPLVLGPVAHSLASVDAINASNERIADLLRGKWKAEIPETGPVDLYIDVRDTAEAHIKALELPEASGHRLFPVASRTSNHEIAKIIRDNFPEFAERLPGPEVKGGEHVDESKAYKWNCDETNKLLKIDWIPIEKSMIDTVNSLKDKGI